MSSQYTGVQFLLNLNISIIQFIYHLLVSGYLAKIIYRKIATYFR